MNAEEAKNLAENAALVILRDKIREAANSGQTEAKGYFGLTKSAADHAIAVLCKDGYGCTTEGHASNIYVSIWWD